MSSNRLFALSALMLFTFGSLGCLIMDSYSDREEEEPEVNNANPNPQPEPEPDPNPRPDPDPRPNEGFIIEGRIEADSTPPGTQVIALWSVTTTSPAYFFALGTGLASGSRFRINLPADELPILALNNGGLGVAMLVALPEDAQLPKEGSLTRTEFNALTAGALGLSKRHAIIYRQERGQPTSPWAFDFTAGYQCAQGVEPAPNQSFETFEPAPCEELTITLDGRRDWVNWR